MAMEGEFKKYLDDVYSEPPIPREALTDECEILVVGAGFGGLLLWHKLQRSRLHRRALLREGRRRRRHLVLEPLSRHRLRRRILQLPAVARGDGLRPVDEVRLGLRDPRILPEHGREVRLLRPLPVPHDGRGDDLGRGVRPLDRRDRSRRQDARALRDPGQRHPDDAEAGAHRGHGEVQGRVVPHLALELQHRPARQDGSASSAPARRRCRRSRSSPRLSSELYVFQRTPSSIDVRDQRATTDEERATWAQRARMGPGTARALRARSRPAAPPSRPTTTTCRARSRTSRSARNTTAS